MFSVLYRQNCLNKLDNYVFLSAVFFVTTFVLIKESLSIKYYWRIASSDVQGMHGCHIV